MARLMLHNNSDEDFDRDDVNRFSYPVYSKTNPKGPRFRSLLCWQPYYEEEEQSIIRVANSGDHRPNYIANYGKYGMRSFILEGDQLDYELPSGYSPENERWVKVRLKRVENSRVVGSMVVTYPSCGSDYGNLIYFTAGYMLVPCEDGGFRYANDYEIIQIDTYRV